MEAGGNIDTIFLLQNEVFGGPGSDPKLVCWMCGVL